MPGTDWEKLLVDNFLTARVRKRSLFELRSRKKRDDFFRKMGHHYADMLIPDRRIGIPAFPVDTAAASLKNILVQYGARENCCFLSRDAENNKKILPIETGIEISRDYATPVFLMCAENLALFHGHYDGKTTPEFILYSGAKSGLRIMPEPLTGVL